MESSDSMAFDLRQQNLLSTFVAFCDSYRHIFLRLYCFRTKFYQKNGASKMQSIGKWLSKPIVKACLMGGITVLIGIVGSILGIVPDEYRIPLYILIGVLFIIYMGLLIFYNTAEVNYVCKCESLERKNKMFEFAMISLISIFQQSARNANKLIHEIVEKGKVNLNSWNFDLAATLVCDKIYRMLCDFDQNCADYDVGYIRLDETTGSNDIIYMNAYANRPMTQPTVLLKRRKISEPHAYYDAQLFRNNMADIEILMDEKAVESVFEYRDTRSRGSHKYSQYIGIPVLCVSDNGPKMVGLLEIACLNGHKLSSDENIVREMAEKYFMPYAQLLLLLHKLEKALLAVPAGSKE